MNSAELTALHTETLTEIALARTLANIARRASTLWKDGYAAQETMHGLYVRCFRVLSPEGTTYSVKVSKTTAEPGTFFGSRCDCPCFKKLRTCKHLQSLTVWVENDDAADAQAEEYDARGEIDDDPYAEF